MNKEQFTDITAWQRETFKSADAESKIAHLREEVEEVAAAVHFGYDSDAVGEEFADCILLIYDAASAYGFTYDQICEAIDKKMVKNKARTWGEPDKNGVVKHIKKVCEGICSRCKKHCKIVGESLCGDCWTDIHGM